MALAAWAVVRAPVLRRLTQKPASAALVVSPVRRRKSAYRDWTKAALPVSGLARFRWPLGSLTTADGVTPNRLRWAWMPPWPLAKPETTMARAVERGLVKARKLLPPRLP